MYADCDPAEVDRGATARPETVGRVRAELGVGRPLRTEVVVDDVEDHREPTLVTRTDECAKGLRPAVGVLRGVGEDAVVPPVAGAGELRDRHQLEGGEAE